MRQYRIHLSDRQRSRTVVASDAKDAIASACGSRFVSARHDCDSIRRDGGIAYSCYEVTVQTGPTRGGCTPVTRTWATVRMV